MAQSTGGAIRLFLEGGRAELGFERHLSGYDAVHAGSALGPDPALDLPAACSLVAKLHGRRLGPV